MANSKGNSKHTQNHSGRGKAKPAKIQNNRVNPDNTKAVELPSPHVEARNMLRKDVDTSIETIKQRVHQMSWDRESLVDLIARTGELISAYNALAALTGGDSFNQSSVEFVPLNILNFVLPKGDEVLISRERLEYLINLEKNGLAGPTSGVILTPNIGPYTVVPNWPPNNQPMSVPFQYIGDPLPNLVPYSGDPLTPGPCTTTWEPNTSVLGPCVATTPNGVSVSGNLNLHQNGQCSFKAEARR